MEQSVVHITRQSLLALNLASQCVIGDTHFCSARCNCHKVFTVHTHFYMYYLPTSQAPSARTFEIFHYVRRCPQVQNSVQCNVTMSRNEYIHCSLPVSSSTYFLDFIQVKSLNSGLYAKFSVGVNRPLEMFMMRQHCNRVI